MTEATAKPNPLPPDPDPTEGLPLYVNGPFSCTTDAELERLFAQEHGG